MTDCDSVAQLLFSNRKLDRDHGAVELKKYISDSDTKKICELQDLILEKLENPDSSWEIKHGSLLGSKVLILKKRETTIDSDSRQFLDKLCKLCLQFLEDDEVRVRLAAGEVLGTLCLVEGPSVYEKCCDRVLELIRINFERENSDAEEVFDASDALNDLSENHIARTRRLSSDAAQIFHDTAGWKCLETSMKCLQFMIEGCKDKFKLYISQELLELIFATLNHTNRFVRETGYFVIGSLVACGTRGDDKERNPFTAERFGHQVAKQLGIGLGDNWSQVRLASSEGARNFLLSFNTDAEREQFFPELLPQMCLNRYYVADGVRIFSQQSWSLIAKENGRFLVKKYIDKFVEYYISQTKANNHAVREAACACIAELASKIDKDAVKPHVVELLKTLVECFQDESWPVRDAACLACGNFILCYPEESKISMVILYPLFINNLKDCIPSVRQGAAGALANVVRAYGSEAFDLLSEKIEEGLKNVANQPSESEKYGQIDKSPANFSVVKRLRDNDIDLHSNQQMYSCGSLAPKMGRGGGCSDHKFRKASEPWEMADGCIHLLAELCQIPEFSTECKGRFSLVVEAVNYKHYTHHVCLLESLCKQLPNIAKGLGKQPFKEILEKFLDPIFYSLTCENILTSSSAIQCLHQLSMFLGPNIFRSRVNMYNPSYVALLDENIAFNQSSPRVY